MHFSLFSILIHLTYCDFMRVCWAKEDHDLEELNFEETSDCIDSSDFREVVRSKAFVDKSLLIREILFGEAITVRLNVLIIAPPKFGKSTNINMLKRFLEIEVDDNGSAKKDVKETINYKLFTEKKLQICKDEILFKENFGRYPVIYIDYSRLRILNSYGDLLEKLTQVISQTYSEHKYLLKNSSLWNDQNKKKRFESYVKMKIEKLPEKNITSSFMWLSKLLQRHFGQEVFLMIDEYDTFIYSLIFKDNPYLEKDIDKIFKLMRGLMEKSVKSNLYMGGAIMTGVMRFDRGDSGNNIRDYEFLEDNDFSAYYGLNEFYLDTLLKNMIPNDTSRCITKQSIEDYYGGYRLYNKSGDFMRIYNLWSVLTLLTLKGQASQNYLFCPEFLNNFKSFFKDQKIKEMIQPLLVGGEVFFDLREPLFKANLLALNNLMKGGEVTREAMEGFARIMYHFGYLTPVNNKGFLVGKFKIPNKKILMELESYVNQ